MAVDAAAQPFRVKRALTYVGGLTAGGLALSVLYATTGVGVPCPFRQLTGWECPLCGGTRMGAALLHGEVGVAYGFNPLALVALVLVGVLGVFWAMEALGGPAVRPPARWRAAARRVGSPRWLAAGLAVAVVYTVLRNLS